MSREVIG